MRYASLLLAGTLFATTPSLSGDLSVIISSNDVQQSFVSQELRQPYELLFLQSSKTAVENDVLSEKCTSAFSEPYKLFRINSCEDYSGIFGPLSPIVKTKYDL